MAHPATTQEPFDGVLEYLKNRRGADASLSDVMILAEITAEAMQSFFESMDTAMYREMREIATYIEKMKSEIGALQPNDLRNSSIPSAGVELGAVIQSTEEATNTIMERAETILAADPDLSECEYRALVEDNVMQIFEACSFQDITGQRVAKVVETLQTIENRVSRFATAFKLRDGQTEMTPEEAAREKRRNELLLNGPQLPQDAKTQAEIDQLFN